MSHVPKRNVERRKAAENSEKKWKEAFEEEEEDHLPEVLLRSLELAEARANHQVISDTLFDNTNCMELEEHENNMTEKCYCTSHTLLEDTLLNEIVMSMACPSCHTNEPVLNYSKDKYGRLENICINCCKCQQNIFTRIISDLDLKNMKCTCNSKNNTIESGEKMSPNESNMNVELLVCDVDVIKQTEVENQYSKCHVENERNNLQNNIINVISRIKKKPHIKPIRPCFFCSKMQVRLSRHIKTTHSNHPYVQNMFKQPMEIQAKMMRQLRAEGIFAENQRRIKAGRFDLLRIRNQGSGELSACVYCRGYYKKKLLSRHKSTCIARPNSKVSSLKYSLMDPKEEYLEKLCTNSEDQNEQCLEGNLDTNFNWNDIIQTENSAADSTDPPEISRIRDILDGLGHGIFSPTNQPHSANGFFIKQEKEDFIEEIIIPTNNDMSAHSGHQFREGESNEDQMLFDSLPAILSNSNVSSDVGNNGCQIPVLQVKVKREENFNEGYGDENHYYLWQDITENDLHNHELLPCDALYQPQRKRKPRSEFQYQFWKKEDENQILSYFTDMIKALKVPGKDACREFLSKNPHIKTDWTRVKYKVYNQIQKHKKKSKIRSDYSVYK